MTKLVMVMVVIALVFLATPARAGDDGQHVYLTTDKATVRSCSSVGTVTDDDVKDLKKKAARAGGNVAVIVNQAGADISFVFTISKVKMLAEVYRCPDGWTPTAPASAPSTNHILEERLLLLETRVLQLEQKVGR